MPEVNWLAVLTAAISSFLLGGLWYSPALFFKAWQRSAGLTDEQLQKGGHPGKVYMVSGQAQAPSAKRAYGDARTTRHSCGRRHTHFRPWQRGLPSPGPCTS